MLKSIFIIRLLIEYIYALLKFYRVLCIAAIVLKFLPAVKRHSISGRIIRSATKSYFRFIKTKILFQVKHKKFNKGWRFMLYFISIYNLNVIIRFLFNLIYGKKTHKLT